jgi:hypothetical protein
MSTAPTTTATIEQLNALVRGELAAVETYSLALAVLTTTPIPELDVNLNCHARRVRDLSALVRELGGTPHESSGFWGAITLAVTEGATVLGRHAILTVLAKGEEQGLKDYQSAAGVVDDETRLLIEGDLIPSQQRAYDRILGLSQSGPPSGGDLLGVS